MWAWSGPKWVREPAGKVVRRLPVQVELVFDQGPVDHDEHAGGAAVVVGGDLLAGGPAEQPDLDPVGAQQPGVPALEGSWRRMGRHRPAASATWSAMSAS
jgi:hypothetical protein